MNSSGSLVERDGKVHLVHVEHSDRTARASVRFRERRRLRISSQNDRRLGDRLGCDQGDGIWKVDRTAWKKVKRLERIMTGEEKCFALFDRSCRGTGLKAQDVVVIYDVVPPCWARVEKSWVGKDRPREQGCCGE